MRIIMKSRIGSTGLKVTSTEFNLKSYIEENKKIINEKLDEYLEITRPKTLWESMKYTVMLDGKRIRPILALETARVLGGNIENVLPMACAIEMLHAQSLIHDDLPCMDNDDLRRGKPTNHKVFGEAIALLAGDALLSYAPQIIIQKTPKSVKPQNLIKALEEYCIAAGALGIVGGQVVDIESENKKIDAETLEYIHNYKTGKLFRLAIRSGAILSDASDEIIDIMTQFADKIGYAFQIADDILDIIGTKEMLGKTPGKDAKTNKNTHPAMFGLENSIKIVNNLCKDATNLLLEYNINSPALKQITESITDKINKGQL